MFMSTSPKLEYKLVMSKSQDLQVSGSYLILSLFLILCMPSVVYLYTTKKVASGNYYCEKFLFTLENGVHLSTSRLIGLICLYGVFVSILAFADIRFLFDILIAQFIFLCSPD